MSRLDQEVICLDDVRTDRRVELVQKLHDLTEAQLMAARTLKSERLFELNQERSHVLFEIQVAFQEQLPDDPSVRQCLAGLASRIKRLEYRLGRVCDMVVATLDSGKPQPKKRTATYGRTGRVV